jgi:hypothetical protein
MTVSPAFFLDLPTRQDIVVHRLGCVSGFRIAPNGTVYVNGREVDSYMDGRKLYNALAGVLTDYVD